MAVRWARLALLAAVGCGGGTAAPGDGGMDAAIDAEARDAEVPDSEPPLSPEEQFLRAYEDAWCRYVLRCDGATAAWPPQETTCHPAIDSELVRNARRLMMDGRIRFDADTAAECLEALAAARERCGVWFSLDHVDLLACGRAFVGLAGAGAPCLRGSPSGCAPEAWCELEPDAAEGTCTIRVPEGEPCNTFVDCAGSPDVWCTEGVCTRLRGEGEACGASLPCQFDLECVGGTCVEPYSGMPCEDSGCGLELRCLDGSCTELLREGDPCTRSIDCEQGTTCWGDPQVCTSNDGHDAGDFCTAWSSMHGDSCLGELVCRIDRAAGTEYQHGTCVLGQPAGAACDETMPCGRQLRCVEGTCVPIALPGEPCDSETVCPLTFRCADGTCQPLPAPGEACDESIGCVQGLCVDGACCLAPEWTPCRPAPQDPPLGICETRCLSDDMCGPPGECGVDCGRGACWPDGDRCAPRCAG